MDCFVLEIVVVYCVFVYYGEVVLLVVCEWYGNCCDCDGECGKMLLWVECEVCECVGDEYGLCE